MADAMDSKSIGVTPVWVRLPPSAPLIFSTKLDKSMPLVLNRTDRNMCESYSDKNISNCQHVT